MSNIGHPTPGFRGLSPSSLFPNLQSLAITIQRVMRGETNNAGTATLATSGTTTVVTDLRVGVHSKIILTPVTEAAAGMDGIGTWVSAVTNDSFTLTHADSAADRQFFYVIAG